MTATRSVRPPPPAKEDRETWFDREVRPVLRGRAMSASAEDLSTAEAADAWQLLDLLREAVEERLKELRSILMSAAERDGRPTEKGGQQISLHGAKIERQKRQASEPAQTEMLSLLAQRKIEILDVYDEVKALVFNPSKASYLVDTGKLSTEEIDAKKKVQYALRVVKSDDWTALFEAIIDRKTAKRGLPRPRATH